MKMALQILRRNFKLFNYIGDFIDLLKSTQLQKQYIKDIIITHEVNGADAKVNVEVKKEGRS